VPTPVAKTPTASIVTIEKINAKERIRETRTTTSSTSASDLQLIQ
jgi:hypothetical protein